MSVEDSESRRFGRSIRLSFENSQPQVSLFLGPFLRAGPHGGGGKSGKKRNERTCFRFFVKNSSLSPIEGKETKQHKPPSRYFPRCIFVGMIQPPQQVIFLPWCSTTAVGRHNSRTRKAPLEAGCSRGPTRSLRSCPIVASRPSLFDERRLNVEWPACRKRYPHSHFPPPRFLARAPLGHALPIYAHPVSRQAE